MRRHSAHGAATKGLAGLVAEQVRPLAVEHAKKHPRFKYFRKPVRTRTSRFLGVPLIDRGVLQGVLIVQTREARDFREDEVRMLSQAAAQVAPVVSEARSLDRFIAPVQERLWSLARNLWWSWDQDSTGLFRDLDPVRWRQLQSQSDFAARRRFRWRESNSAPRNWCCTAASTMRTAASANISKPIAPGARGTPACLRPRPVAYFSAEFGLHESIPIYSGGLGILAGDHIKSASDLDIPLVGIGLFYGQGYFRQRLDLRRLAAGRVHSDRCESAADGAGDRRRTAKPVTVQIETRTGFIRARVWRVKVGRCDLLLLDSNVEGNAPEDRELTSRLYGGDGRIRIRQELLLGVGGFRALKAMGITPGVLHLNEGHSGFAVLEAIHNRMQEEGLELRRSGAARFARSGFHHAHAGARGPRSLQRRFDRRASRAAARTLGPVARAADGNGPRESGKQGRRFLHDGAGLANCAARERGLRAARRSVARDVEED